MGNNPSIKIVVEEIERFKKKSALTIMLKQKA